MNKMKFSKIILILSLSVSSFAYSQTSSEVDDFLDQELAADLDQELKELETLDYDVLDNLKTNDDKRFNKSFRPPKKIGKRKFWEPIPFQALLKKDAIILDIKADKYLRVPNKIFVVAKILRIGSKYSYLKVKDEWKYKTVTQNLTSVDNMVTLHPQEDPTIIYEAPSRFNSTDKTFPLEVGLTLGFDSYSADYYAEIFRGTNKTALGNHFDLKSYYNSGLDFDMGVNLSYNYGSWSDEDIGKASWTAFYIGPTIRYPFWEETDSFWAVHLSVLKSLYHKSKKEPDSHTFSSNAIQMEIERVGETGWGPFIFGGGIRYQRSSVKDTTEFLQIPTVRGDILSLSFTVGYLFKWNL